MKTEKKKKKSKMSEGSLHEDDKALRAEHTTNYRTFTNISVPKYPIPNAQYPIRYYIHFFYVHPNLKWKLGTCWEDVVGTFQLLSTTRRKF